jgi:hypothetical protein
MSMDVEDAICIVLTLQHASQTSMTADLRAMYLRANRVINDCARRRIDAERRASKVSNGER